VHNIDEYINLLLDKMLFSGMRANAEAFITGFNKNFSIKSLKCFTSFELENIICGSDSESWDFNTLIENIVPNHGYSKNRYIIYLFVYYTVKSTISL